MIERRRDEATGAVVYRLTDKGRALSQILREIEAWVDTWDDRPGQRAGGDA
jgi:DNA-binding HxlR family transcriptional regulator